MTQAMVLANFSILQVGFDCFRALLTLIANFGAVVVCVAFRQTSTCEIGVQDIAWVTLDPNKGSYQV